MKSALSSVTECIEKFYKTHGFDVVFAITAEELFPIMLDIIKNAADDFVETISIDLLISSLFMSEGMMMGEVGWSLSNWLAAHEYVSSFR